MKTVLKKFLMVAIFCSSFLINAKPGEPELVFDEKDPEIAVGIKLNLPGDVLNVLEEYTKEHPSHLKASITQQALEDQGEVNCTEDFVAIILETHKKDLLLTGNILGNNFFFYLNSALNYKNTAITCAICSAKTRSNTQEYLEKLGRLIQEYF